MELIELIKALLFGIVEGITEWLPISSTGHMMLLNQFVKLDVSADFYDTFLVVIQLGAIMAVILLYFNRLNPFSSKKTREQKRGTWAIWAKVVVGSIPAGIVGLALDDWMETNIMNNADLGYVVVACALIAYGIVFIVIEQVNRRRIKKAKEGAYGKHSRVALEQQSQLQDPGAAPAGAGASEAEQDESNLIARVRDIDHLSWGRAFAIGIFQSLAIIPGTSRSGSIIIGSMLLGTSRTVAAEFAFFLAIPIMFGWSLLKFLRHGFAYSGLEWAIFAVGIVTAFLVSVLSIKFLMNYIKKNDFTAFGVYRIIVGIAVLVIFGVVF